MFFALNFLALISALSMALGAIGLACVIGLSDWHGGLHLQMDCAMRVRASHARWACMAGAAGLVATKAVGA